ncbi:Period circadian protein like protein 2 [Tupaia chinensis]|uniref:Period circadian protein homolog 2 n=1 Tax=Tupaia chinensis TaxID=246437 RepID=L9KLE5_TUPCH|nr:Period circadian protein like protein 2 [Tupaia chinensis]
MTLQIPAINWHRLCELIALVSEYSSVWSENPLPEGCLGGPAPKPDSVGHLPSASHWAQQVAVGGGPKDGVPLEVLGGRACGAPPAATSSVPSHPCPWPRRAVIATLSEPLHITQALQRNSASFHNPHVPGVGAEACVCLLPGPLPGAQGRLRAGTLFWLRGGSLRSSVDKGQRVTCGATSVVTLTPGFICGTGSPACCSGGHRRVLFSVSDSLPLACSFILDPTMNGYVELPPGPSSPTKELAEPTPGQAPLQEDVDMSSGSSGNENSMGQDSQGSDCDDSRKELGMLVEPSDACQSASAFSLMMAKSEHTPPASGCSSEQSAKADTHKELVKTLKELKVHLPADKKAKGKASTLATLKYALRSVKQVKANEEYYQLLMASESHPCGADVPSYSTDEIESVTSEYLVKNPDMFAVAVSLSTGKVLYISDQVASIFHCKRDAFSDAKFVEFLAPHDVSVFHSSTTPYRLPSWSICGRVDSFTQECTEEKSFFCRVSVGKSHENEVRYHPFRMTPYLVKVRDRPAAESQLCCLLLAERVHSGYEAPRIPPEKRIFTTTHTPNCLFQDVDERAVPLLGFLPQDLIQTPVLMQLHPSDRPLMLAIHKKILQSGGQPFDYSPLRFRARNGEYITLDTSWSSFVNPWSRKISFIIGRHRVRVGPLNEDVFAAHPCVEEKAPPPSMQELTEQIHRLLLQPVPHSGSSGYGSLGSNGSHEHLLSQTSSSDSNGHEDARRRRSEICKNGNKTKTKNYSHVPVGQKKSGAAVLNSQVSLPACCHQATQPSLPLCRGTDRDAGGQAVSCALTWEQVLSLALSLEMQSRSLMEAVPAAEKDSSGASIPEAGFPEELACKGQPACSYQQVSCLDSVIRYLESCSEAATLKRKCEFPANIPTPKSSDRRKATLSPGLRSGETAPPSKVNSHAEVSARLTSLTLPGKAESVVSLTSQCSYSSTIVHVGDKKPQPELEMVEDAASGTESLDCLAGPSLPCGHGQEKEPFQKLGLTKEILAAHTQKEEQSFLHKFREARRLSLWQPHCHYLQERAKGQGGERAAPGLRNTSGIDSSWKKSGKNRKLKSKRAKPRDSSESTGSGGPVPHRPPLVGLNATAWSPSDTSQSSCPAVAFPTSMPAYSLPMFPAPGIVPGPGAVVAPPVAPHASFTVPTVSVDAQQQFVVQPPPLAAPLAPVVAFMLPSCPFPPETPSLSQAFFPGQPHFPGHPTLTPGTAPASQPESPSRTSLLRQSCACPATPATPPLAAGAVGRASPPLFQSRGSSPLQLNLLQLEEVPEAGPGVTGTSGTSGTAATQPDRKPGTSQEQQPKAPSTERKARVPLRTLRGQVGKVPGGSLLSTSPPSPQPPSLYVLCRDGALVNSSVFSLSLQHEEPSDTQNSDALSTSSDLLNLLLNEDLCSATGSALSGSGASATSDSLGSGSLGCGVAGSGAGSSDTSHTSKYFGSIDSSESSHRAKAAAATGEGEHFLKHVLQGPIWLLMADTDGSVMMTYQLPPRNVDTVLKEDREKLTLLRKAQPRFTESQKRELREVHPWVQTGGLPTAIEVTGCVYCENKEKDNFRIPYEEDIPPLGLSDASDTKEEENGPPPGSQE